MQLSTLFLVLGTLFLAGLLSDQLGRKVHVPRVTLLLACGLIVGNSGLDLLPAEIYGWYEFLSIAALTLVAFLLGSALTASAVKRAGRAVLSVSLAIVFASLVLVALGLLLLGAPWELALVLAAISTATAPAATQDVIRQSGRTGRFVEMLKGVVAIDDAWGLIAFSLVIALVSSGTDAIAHAAHEVAGAILIGLLVGLPAAFLTGRLQEGEPLQAEALGIVCICAGLALWFEVSFLLAGMTAGAVIANLARHHNSAFHEIENIQWPFMILFFILAGASLHVEALAASGWILLAYVILRTLARYVGGLAGGALGKLNTVERRWIGIAMLPQAGVAIGMSLVAAQQLPEYADQIVTLTVATTVVFEVIGPIGTLLALRKTDRTDTGAEEDGVT